jgi:MFS family permease
MSEEYAHATQGMLQLVLPPIMYFLNAFPQHRKNVMWLGNLICCIAPIAGGLSTTVRLSTRKTFLELTTILTRKQPVVLVLTLGVLYGIGAGLLFAPSIHLMDDWFSKRKSLAYGVM